MFSGTSREIFRTVVAVTMLTVGAVSCAQSVPARGYFGVLKADEAHLEDDRGAGVNLVEIGVRWDEYEPNQGVFDDGYRTKILKRIELYRQAGFHISLATATQYTPQWIKANLRMQAASQFENDYSGMANLFFDQSVRDEAEKFIADVVHHAGAVDFYRIGLSHNGEMLLPVASRGQWWAMDPKAQGDIPGRPATIPDPPFKHWYPGVPLHGEKANKQQLKAWWMWYFNASVDAHDWESAAIRRAGFKGKLQYVVPGPGIRPHDMETAFDNGLRFEPADRYHLMNVGAVWFLLLDQLRDRNALLDISSVYDSSGTPRGNPCLDGDAQVDYLHDRSVESWSSTRWLSFHARRTGLATIGENPGSDSPDAMRRAFSLAKACGLSGLQWAFDDELFDGTHATLQDLKVEIDKANKKGER